jgi:hypothetical protein
LRKLRVPAAEWTSILVSRTSWLLDAELRGLVQRCLNFTERSQFDPAKRSETPFIVKMA